MFEEEMTELQSDMVDICNEYSKGLADKIFIYVSYEGLLNTDYFYSINGDIIERHKLNTSGINADFDVSVDCQKQVLNILKEDVHKIKAVCDKYKNQFTDDMALSDIVNAWFEEEKAKLEGGNAEPTGKYKA